MERNIQRDAKNQQILNQNSVKRMRKKVENYDNDPDREKRLNNHICKFCHYVTYDRMAGQAFTTSKCKNCGKELMSPTTDTNDYCDECAKELNVCKHCGAVLD